MLHRVCLLLIALGLLGGGVNAFAQEGSYDLSATRTYLIENLAELQASAENLALNATAYFVLAEAADYDYAALWAEAPTEVAELLQSTKDAWISASPLYEKVEGIVAGVPTLAEFDVILDAGASGEEDPEGGVPFDLALRDGRVFERPGNLFGLLEGTLWGTRAEFISTETADTNGDGALGFGDALPDAYVLEALANTFKDYVDALVEAGEAWEPNVTDAFTALVVMTPTMSEYFASWKESRFVLGDATEQTDFGVISRLADIQDILSGLIVVYDNISPLVSEQDADLDQQIKAEMADLLTYVAEIHQQELDGEVFTPEEADLFGTEAQDRAMQIAGRIAQAAALLEIELPEA
jgi:hypothetical protein